MQWFPAWIAIYGAVLSSLVAAFQIRKHMREREFLTVKIERAYGEDGETIDFRIANTGGSMTRINEIFFNSNEMGSDGLVEKSNGYMAELFVHSMWNEREESIELPVKLLPGDAIYARLKPGDHKVLLDNKIRFDVPYVNAFSLEIDHSQSPQRLEVHFSLSEGGPFCKPSGLRNVGRADLIRSRIWCLDRGD